MSPRKSNDGPDAGFTKEMLNQTHKLFPFQLKKAWTTSRASVHSSQLSKNNALNFPGASPETDLLELPALKIRKEDYSSAGVAPPGTGAHYLAFPQGCHIKC